MRVLLDRADQNRALVAMEIGVTPKRIGDFLRGARPSNATIARAAHALGFLRDDLLALTVEQIEALGAGAMGARS